MFKGKVLLFSLLLIFATSLNAGDVDPCKSDAGISCVGMRLQICPAGDFEFISNACGGVSDYIWASARNLSDEGIPGIPWTDWWINACDVGQELYLCASSIVADSLTNEDGYTTFSGRMSAGGCILTDGVWIACQGKVFQEEPACVVDLCIDIIITSPDITADGAVNLSDFTALGLSYNKNLGDPGYNPCCDFNDDDKCNLSDFTFLGQHYYHECL